MKLFKFFLFLIPLILSSCSTSFESPNNVVSILTTSNDLIINNQLFKKIYFFTVEQQILTVINWVPSKTGPTIQSGKSHKISFNEIFNGKTEPVKSRDKVVVYWWTDALQDFNNINLKMIEI
jgi:hypothetical protein